MQKVEICGVDTSGLPKLSAKENEELMLLIKKGDKKAREKFIVGNMRLVLSLVKRFRAKNGASDDVFQGNRQLRYIRRRQVFHLRRADDYR